MANDSTQKSGNCPPGVSFSPQREKKSEWDFDDLPHIRGHVVWGWDIAADTVRFSREWRHIMFCPDDDTLETTVASWWRRMHEDDVESFQQAARDLVEGRTDRYEALFRLQRNDGCWAWLLSRGTVAESIDGKPARVLGALMDISGLRADPKFQHKNAGMGIARYYAMLENSPDLIVRLDRELFPLYINPNVSQYLKRKNTEFSCAEGIDALGIEPQHLDFLQRNVNRVFKEGASTREMVTFASGYGHKVTGEYSFWPEFDEEDGVVAAMAQFRDLTDQVRAEQRAQWNELRLDALYRLTQMDNAPEADVLRFVSNILIQMTGSESGFLFFPQNSPHRSGRMVWAKGGQTVIGEKFFSDDDFPQDLVRLARDENGLHKSRMMQNGDGARPVHVSTDGARRIIRYISAPVMDGDRVVCVAGVCNKDSDYNESDLQQLEAFINGAWLVLRRHEFVRELQRAKDAAERANKVKDEFLANVSHELRTPLNGMLSMLQLMDLLPLTEQQRDYVQTASVSGQALLRIISDILDFSRMESGKMTLETASFDFKSTIESSVSLFLSEAERKGLKLEACIAENIPPVLLGDDARVRQIVFNIVGNALKFTEQGGVHVECSLLPQRPKGKVCIYLVVGDTGIGIPQEKQSSIFEAFTQIDSSSTRKYPGTGLGLSIVQRLVERMGGGVTVESEVGAGTTIHCTMQFAVPVGEREQKKAKRATRAETLVCEPLDILVAEDDAVSRFAIQAFLHRAGHRAICVGNGRQALEALLLHPFHCLFTDIQMPDMDGLEVIRRIREGRLADVTPTKETISLLEASGAQPSAEGLSVPPDLIAVTVSAHTMTGDKERFLGEGMDFYISKPILMKELEHVLKKISVRVFRRKK